MKNGKKGRVQKEDFYKIIIFFNFFFEKSIVTQLMSSSNQNV